MPYQFLYHNQFCENNMIKLEHLKLQHFVLKILCGYVCVCVCVCVWIYVCVRTLPCSYMYLHYRIHLCTFHIHFHSHTVVSVIVRQNTRCNAVANEVCRLGPTALDPSALAYLHKKNLNTVLSQFLLIAFYEHRLPVHVMIMLL